MVFFGSLILTQVLVKKWETNFQKFPDKTVSLNFLTIWRVLTLINIKNV